MFLKISTGEIMHEQYKNKNNRPLVDILPAGRL